jgi:nucleotide-binding universal stress UspA family protein
MNKGVGMYADVVVGIKETYAGRDALALAQTLAPDSIHFALAHVRVLEAPGRRAGNSALTTRNRTESLELLSAARERAGAAAEILSVLAPDVGSGLHNVAESRGSDLLVVGCCRRSAIDRVRVGDDTRAVIHRAPCAVAVAPRGYRRRVKTIEVIGVAYDDSAQSNVALAHARALSLQTGAKVVAHHVIQLNVPRVGVFPMPPVTDIAGEMAHAREQLGCLGDAEVSLAVGSSGAELAGFSERVDLLICGSRDRGIVRRVALGSTSDYLSRHCACPLIITTAAVPGPALSVAPDRLSTA